MKNSNIRGRRLRYTPGGFIFIAPGDDYGGIVDAMLETDYQGEFCLGLSFDPVFIARLMAAGFLVMSAAPLEPDSPDIPPQYILLPKLHLERSVIFFPDLRETKTVRRLLKHYELRFDTDFDRILERCAEIHGEDWLTGPLRESIRRIRALYREGKSPCGVWPVSFGLYRDGKLAAGEFGVIAGRVYTSYSGYREENSAGTVQLILTGRYLRDRGFAFWDLGMPLDYKTLLGAVNISPHNFVKIFREAMS
jgi:Leu/Phe-tRNA-protein transferase